MQEEIFYMKKCPPLASYVLPLFFESQHAAQKISDAMCIENVCVSLGTLSQLRDLLCAYVCFALKIVASSREMAYHLGAEIE